MVLSGTKVLLDLLFVSRPTLTSLPLKILTGQGKMMVTVVGEYSCVGKIASLLKSDDAEVTPL